MEDEQKDLTTPTRSRRNFYKILTITLASLLLLIVAGYATVEATSSSPFCGTCHEMNPEYNTWKASSHAEVACKECHIKPDVVSYAKAKANGLVELYYKATDSYTAPIEMPKDIPNSQCEQCHDMKTRNTTATGDVIIPHNKHLAKDIKCVQCHSGVAHGDVKDRNVTFKTDYDKWSADLGKSMMTTKYTSPKMEECMKCHEARDVSNDCKTCHKTGEVPKSHKAAGFATTSSHGQLAEKDIKKCNSCHSLMSDNEIKTLQTKSASEQFLSTGKAKEGTITAQEYARENTYCKKCHTKRPASHGTTYVDGHGAAANADKSKCLACHSDQKTIGGTITSNGLVSNAVPTASAGSVPACSSCHPASHANNQNFREAHPVDITGVTKPNATCYSCHSKPKCESCHKTDVKTEDSQT